MRYFRVCYLNKTASIFHMDGNKARRYVINKFFERTNKVTLQQTNLKVVKENQRKYGHTKLFHIHYLIIRFEICWKKYKHKNYFYRHSSKRLGGDEKLIEKNGRYNIT